MSHRFFAQFFTRFSHNFSQIFAQFFAQVSSTLFGRFLTPAVVNPAHAIRPFRDLSIFACYKSQFFDVCAFYGAILVFYFQKFKSLIFDIRKCLKSNAQNGAKNRASTSERKNTRSARKVTGVFVSKVRLVCWSRLTRFFLLTILNRCVCELAIPL